MTTHPRPTLREFSVSGPGCPHPESMSLRHAALLAAAVAGACVVVRHGQHVPGRHGCGHRWTDWLDLTPDQVHALLTGRPVDLPAAA